MGSILDDARTDNAMILTEGGFETELKFTSPADVIVATKGTAIRRTDTLEFDDGSKKMSPFSSISVSLAPFGFTTTYISFKGWKVEFTDSEKLQSYNLADSLPNRTLGFVNITLKDE